MKRSESSSNTPSCHDTVSRKLNNILQGSISDYAKALDVQSKSSDTDKTDVLNDIQRFLQKRAAKKNIERDSDMSSVEDAEKELNQMMHEIEY